MDKNQKKPNLDSIDDSKNTPFRYFESVNNVKVHHFYINQQIGAPEEYVDMIHQLKTCSPNDIVYIYLNSPGGYVTTGIQIINAMRSCPAKIITVLESEAHSMATFLFLAGDEFIVHDNCRMMFHNFSSGMYGKGNELGLQLESTKKWYDGLVRDFCNPFLSQDEVDRISRGEDLWLGSDEIRTRLIDMANIVQQNMQDRFEDEAEALRNKAQSLLDQANQLCPAKPKKKAAAKPARKTKSK